MSGRTAMEQIKQNAEQTKETIQELKSEVCFRITIVLQNYIVINLQLGVLNADYNSIMAQHLLEENAKLAAAVEKAKQQLVDLEIKNGVKQIPLPAKST